MEHQCVLILDFGGQYAQLIARRVRELGVYCEVHPHTLNLGKAAQLEPIGIIFSGGQDSAYTEDSPKCDPGVYRLGVPILGIGYGAQLIAHQQGGKVTTPDRRERGRVKVNVNADSRLFLGLAPEQDVWMSHPGCIEQLPPGFARTAHSGATPYAAFESTGLDKTPLFGLQFHPETEQTDSGKEILRTFLFTVCGATGDWTMADYAARAVEEIRAQVGDGKVLLALSGGVDSSVVAALLFKAIGSQLSCIFVDHGLMRKDEGNEIMQAFKNLKLNLVRVDAAERFLSKLAGVTDPERKRKIIGEEFIRVFEEQAKKIGKVDFLAQGTIYPDIIESGTGGKDVLKSHHNVGGLPERIDFREIIEPVRTLFKSEVRALGTELGLPACLTGRQPFPGPGLAVRVIGEITREKLEILREADFIFRNEITKAGIAPEISQYFAVLTDMRSVGINGEKRTYEHTLVLRAVVTCDFMTAQWARIPHNVLASASARITASVRGINRVVYDITDKPPGAIEWE